MADAVVFLDIDGVLQPFTQYRFEHIRAGDMLRVYEELQQKTGVDYRKYNIYDVAAVYYDWDKYAVKELKRILDSTGAQIVLSSSWRDETMERMTDFFRIHTLDDLRLGNDLKGHFVETDRSLTRELADKCIEILSV